MNTMKRIISIAALFIQATTICLAEDWMERIDDNAYFSQISIPGTHDSATGEGWTGALAKMFGPIAGLTQDLNISQQLDCGIRAFDLRPCIVNDELVINHGILQTKAKFEETLKLLCQFVTAHPSEFVVVVMRHESEGDDNSDLWVDMMSNCLNNDDIRPLLVNYKRDITVGELRGKVLLLSRDSYAYKPIGGYITGWDHKPNYVSARIAGPVGATGVLYVQDFYEVMDNMTAKLNGIVKLLDFSTKSNVSMSIRHFIVCINCASGYTESASTNGIRDNAAQCNQKVIDYLADDTHAGPTGIIFMDFAGTDTSGAYDVKGLELVTTIINNNQCYVPVKKDEPTGISQPRSSQEIKTSRHDLLGHKQNQQPYRPTIVIEQRQKIIKK